MNLTRRKFIGGIAAASISAALGGCNENDKAKTTERTLLSMQASWINDAEFLGYYAAMDDEHQLYRQVGLDLEYLSGGPQVIPESSLLSRKADVALTTPETTAQYILRDRVPFVIIGAQYQTNPIGVVSLEKNPIRSPQELIGKKLAVAPVNRLTVEAMFRFNDIDPSQVELVPYTYDPKILINGTADASVDFITNVPYTINRLGYKAHSFLLYEAGFKIYNDTVVVHRQTLEDRFEDLASFLAASMMGWEAVYSEGAYESLARKHKDSWFSGTGRTIENEIEFAEKQLPLMKSPHGFFHMTNKGIQDNIDSLAMLGLDIPSEVFDTRPLRRAQEIINELHTDTA